MTTAGRTGGINDTAAEERRIELEVAQRIKVRDVANLVLIALSFQSEVWLLEGQKRVSLKRILEAMPFLAGRKGPIVIACLGKDSTICELSIRGAVRSWSRGEAFDF